MRHGRGEWSPLLSCRAFNPISEHANVQKIRKTSEKVRKQHGTPEFILHRDMLVFAL